MKYATLGNALFCIGAVFELAGIQAGTNIGVVGYLTIIYGIAMVVKGYLP